MKSFKEFFQLGVTKPSKFDVQNYLNGLGTRLMQLPDIIKTIEKHFKNIKNLKLDRVGRKVLSFEEVIHVDEVAQDKDIKDKDGTQPAKYYAGDMAKSTKDKRAAHFAKKKSGPAPGDASAKTKPSKHTKKYKQMFGEEIEGLKNKAEKSGMPYGILKKVYDRGMAAYKTGHRPGTTAQQWAFARVNSFVTKSKGTWGGADKDLAAKVRG